MSDQVFVPGIETTIGLPLRAQGMTLWRKKLIDDMKANFLKDGVLHAVVHLLCPHPDPAKSIYRNFLVGPMLTSNDRKGALAGSMPELVRRFNAQALIFGHESWELSLGHLPKEQRYAAEQAVMEKYGSLEYAPGRTEVLTFTYETVHVLKMWQYAIERDVNQKPSLGRLVSARNHGRVKIGGRMCGWLYQGKRAT